jgi:hypothetical protein
MSEKLKVHDFITEKNYTFTAVIAPTDLPQDPFLALFHNEPVPEYIIIYGEYGLEYDRRDLYAKPLQVVAQVGNNVVDLMPYVDLRYIESLLQDDRKVVDQIATKLLS